MALVLLNTELGFAGLNPFVTSPNRDGHFLEFQHVYSHSYAVVCVQLILSCSFICGFVLKTQPSLVSGEVSMPLIAAFTLPCVNSLGKSLNAMEIHLNEKRPTLWG